MSTPIGAKRTEPRKPLRRTTPLKRTKPMKKASATQRKRNAYLRTIIPPADGLCKRCHKTPDWRGLAKHHKKFRSHGGTDDDSNLIWVCGRCHAELHGLHEVV